MKAIHRGETRFDDSQKVGERELLGTVVIEQRIGAGGQPVCVLSGVQIDAIMVHDEAHDLDVLADRTL